MSYIGLASFVLFWPFLGLWLTAAPMLGGPNYLPLIFSISAGLCSFYAGHFFVPASLVNSLLTWIGVFSLGAMLFGLILLGIHIKRFGLSSMKWKKAYHPISLLDVADRDPLIERVRNRMDIGDTREKMIAARVRLARKGAYTSPEQNEDYAALLKQ